MGVSVILCCYNSVKRLPATLNCLSLQTGTTGLLWEVILVDNNSSDNTGDKAREVWDRIGGEIPLRIVSESIPGLSHARYRGIMEAQYQTLIFCDDDNWLNPEYVNTAFRSMNYLPNAGAIGGWGEAICEVNPPDWFNEFSDHFATGPQGTTEIIQDISDSKGYIYGAGAVFNKRCLLELFANNYSLSTTDRVGDILVSGGDNELCYCLRLLGYKVYFDPSLKFGHFIPAARISIEYLTRLNFGFGYSYLLLLPYKYKLEGRPMTGLKTSWVWLLIVGILQYVVNDLPIVCLGRGRRTLRFKVNLAGRKGWLWSVWKNRGQLTHNFAYINNRFN